MSKHLTISDRTTILDRLKKGVSFKAIANEIKNHYRTRQTGCLGHCFNDCLHRIGCTRASLCDRPCSRKRCSTCKYCRNVCSDYEREICVRLLRAPYVCDGCSEKKKCTLEKREYKAAYAQEEYETILRESREGHRLHPDELQMVDDLVSPLVKQGQSPYAIWQNNKDTLQFSTRTMYRLIADQSLEAGVMDLPQTVQRKLKPPKRGHNYKIDKKCLENRRFEDYRQLMESAVVFPTVEMDTVIGKPGGKALLTFQFAEAHFMAAFLLEKHNARCVRQVFDRLYTAMGLKAFRAAFPAILTDNGTEFSDPEALEFWKCQDQEPVRRTRIFYCHPNASLEKPHVEKNHTLLRRVLPKGTSFDGLVQADVELMMSHVNSYYM